MAGKRKYTNEEILANIKEFGDILGHAPTQKEYKEYSGRLISINTARRYFGSWQNACKIAGTQQSLYVLTHIKQKNENSQEQIQDMLLKEIYQTIVSHPEMAISIAMEHSLHAKQTYIKYLGFAPDIKKLLKIKYGINMREQPWHKIAWTKELLDKEYRRIKTLLGHPPVSKEIQRYSIYHGIFQGIKKIYGTLNKLRAAIGDMPRICKRTEEVIKIKKQWCIQRLRETYKTAPENKHYYTGMEWCKLSRVCHPVVYRYFGSITNWFKEAKLPVPITSERRTRTISYENVFRFLRSMARKLKHAPTRKEYDNNEEKQYCSGTLTRHFGTWKNVLQAAKIKGGRVHAYSREDVIQAIKKAVAKLKQCSLSFKQYRTIAKGPSWPSIKRLFGSWKNALKAAGLK